MLLLEKWNVIRLYTFALTIVNTKRLRSTGNELIIIIITLFSHDHILHKIKINEYNM